MLSYNKSKHYYQLVKIFDAADLHAKNHIYPCPLPWNITKILQTYYFGYYGQSWPRPPKTMTSTARKFLCLLANKKSNWSLNVFYRYYTLQSPKSRNLPRTFWEITLKWKILSGIYFFAVFASPRWTFIFIFFPLFSSFLLGYPVWYINITFLALKI